MILEAGNDLIAPPKRHVSPAMNLLPAPIISSSRQRHTETSSLEASTNISEIKKGKEHAIKEDTTDEEDELDEMYERDSVTLEKDLAQGFSFYLNIF